MPVNSDTIISLGYEALLTEPVKNINGRIIGKPTLKENGQITRMMPNGTRLIIRGYPNGTISIMDMKFYNMAIYKTDKGLLTKLESYDLQQATVLLRVSRITKILKDL